MTLVSIPRELKAVVISTLTPRMRHIPSISAMVERSDFPMETEIFLTFSWLFLVGIILWIFYWRDHVFNFHKSILTSTNRMFLASFLMFLMGGVLVFSLAYMGVGFDEVSPRRTQLIVVTRMSLHIPYVLAFWVSGIQFFF